MGAREFSRPLRYAAVALAVIAVALLGVDTNVSRSGYTTIHEPAWLTAQKSAPPADPGGYLPWSTAPSPLPAISAYVGVAGAWGAANIYNTATNAFTPTQAPGTGMLDTDQCYFVCFGAPATASHHFIVYGNDLITGMSFTHHGAAGDCGGLSPCPGSIKNTVFGVSTDPKTNPFFVAVDKDGNIGVLASLYAATAVTAGAGSTAPSPSAGSLVSDTGPAEGDFLLGAAGPSDYVKCDWGETQSSVLTCNEPFVVATGMTSAGLNSSGTAWATGGLQPHGTSGGFAPEAFPVGAATAHPQILSGTCTITGTALCTFPNSFSFIDTTYNCTVSAQGTTPFSDGYANTSATGITIYPSPATTTVTFSYICMR